MANSSFKPRFWVLITCCGVVGHTFDNRSPLGGFVCLRALIMWFYTWICTCLLKKLPTTSLLKSYSTILLCDILEKNKIFFGWQMLPNAITYSCNFNSSKENLWLVSQSCLLTYNTGVRMELFIIWFRSVSVVKDTCRCFVWNTILQLTLSSKRNSFIFINYSLGK